MTPPNPGVVVRPGTDPNVAPGQPGRTPATGTTTQSGATTTTTDPSSRQPGTREPGSNIIIQPGTAGQPGTAQPGTGRPGTSQPGTGQFGTGQFGTGQRFDGRDQRLFGGTSFYYYGYPYGFSTLPLHRDATGAVYWGTTGTTGTTPATSVYGNQRLPDQPRTPDTNIRQSLYSGPDASRVPSASYMPMPEDAERALILVSVPQDARVWFDDSPTEQRGMNRLFISPRIEAGRDYAYDVKASWRENDREVTRNKKVSVRAGELARVSFVSGEELPQPKEEGVQERDRIRSIETPQDPSIRRTPADRPDSDQPSDRRDGSINRGTETLPRPDSSATPSRPQDDAGKPRTGDAPKPPDRDGKKPQ